MSSLPPTFAQRWRLLGYSAGLIAFTMVCGLWLLTAAKALMLAADSSDFPEALAIKLELLPVIFPVHMVTGGLSLLLVPLAWALRKRRRWHVPLGRLTAADVLIAGVTAIPVAWVEPVNVWSAAGFIAQAMVWLSLLAAGIWHIRHGRRDSHQAAMLMMAATTSGAFFFRIYLMFWAMFAQGRHFDLFYACDAWIAWALPLGMTWYLLRRHRGRQRILAA